MNAVTDIETQVGVVDGVSIVSNLIRLVQGKHHVVEIENDTERAYLKDACSLKEETGNVSAQSEYELSLCHGLLAYLDTMLTERLLHPAKA